MAATPLSVIQAVSPHGAGPGAGVAEATADVEEGNSFVNTGREYLIVTNADVEEEVEEELVEPEDHTVTIQGKAFTVLVGETIVLGPFPTFQNFGELVTVTADDASVELLVYSVPDRNSTLR